MAGIPSAANLIAFQTAAENGSLAAATFDALSPSYPALSSATVSVSVTTAPPPPPSTSPSGSDAGGTPTSTIIDASAGGGGGGLLLVGIAVFLYLRRLEQLRRAKQLLALEDSQGWVCENHRTGRHGERSGSSEIRFLAWDILSFQLLPPPTPYLHPQRKPFEDVFLSYRVWCDGRRCDDYPKASGVVEALWLAIDPASSVDSEKPAAATAKAEKAPGAASDADAEGAKKLLTTGSSQPEAATSTSTAATTQQQQLAGTKEGPAARAADSSTWSFFRRCSPNAARVAPSKKKSRLSVFWDKVLRHPSCPERRSNNCPLHF